MELMQSYSWIEKRGELWLSLHACTLFLFNKNAIVFLQNRKAFPLQT